MCNFSYPFSELRQDKTVTPKSNIIFRPDSYSQQPFSDQNGFKTIPILVAPSFTWILISAPTPPPKKEPKAKLR